MNKPNTTANPAANAAVLALASHGDAIDAVFEQSTAPAGIPAGVFQNLKPWLDKPNPYVPGNKEWLDVFTPSIQADMVAPNGEMTLVSGSTVETGIFYNRAVFAKAHITSDPATWAEWIADMAKIQKIGVTPFIFPDGGSCNPGWYEDLAATSLFAPVAGPIDVDHSKVALSALDTAVGIHEGVLSMKNPRYAAIWQLLASLKPYMSTSASSYDACATISSTSPPLAPESLLIQGKVAMEWGGSWWIPEIGQAGFNGYGVFRFPLITKASTPYGTGVDTTGLIGGDPTGFGSWSVTSEKADHTMTPAKTAGVVNFLEWLLSPEHDNVFAVQGLVPTMIGTKLENIPGLAQLLPTASLPLSVNSGVLSGTLSASTASASLRLVQGYLDGSVSYSSFASQFQTLLTSSAASWAATNHVNLSKYSAVYARKDNDSVIKVSGVCSLRAHHSQSLAGVPVLGLGRRFRAARGHGFLLFHDVPARTIMTVHNL